MVKLGVFDLDGTLLTGDGRLPETFWQDLELLHGRGVSVAIASARPARFLFAMFDRDTDLLISGDSTGSLTDAKDLVYASQEWISKQYLADAPAWGRMDPERWNSFYTWLYSNGLTAHDLSGLGFTNDFLPGE